MDAPSKQPLSTPQRVLLALIGLALLAAAFIYVEMVREPQWPGQLLWYGGQGVVALLLAFACGATRPTLAGIAIGSFVYWVGFYQWVFSATHPEALAWLLYLFAAPGGWLMAMLLARLERRVGWPGGIRWVVISAIATLLALLAVQAGWMVAL